MAKHWRSVWMANTQFTNLAVGGCVCVSVGGGGGGGGRQGRRNRQPDPLDFFFGGGREGERGGAGG